MRTRLLAFALLALALTGCATKRDLRQLSVRVDSLRASQEAQLRQLQQENRQLLDSLSLQNTRTRGDLINQLLQMERQLVQIQELTGQGQQRINELREQLRAREQALQAPGADTAPATAASGENPQELFDAALASLRRGSHSTARAGFEEVVRTAPRHALAAEAQFQIGESYAAQKDWPRALEAYAQVGEQYPAAPRAPTALLRMAAVEVERGNRERARSLLTQITRAYPRSPEAPQARAQLQKLK